MILNETIDKTIIQSNEIRLPIVDDSYNREHTVFRSPDSYKREYFFVRNAGRYERINVSDILFIKASGSYAKIITKRNKVTISMNMKHILSQISSDTIIKCHRSFAVNVDNIEAFDDISIYISYNETVYELPLSVTYRKKLQDHLPRLKA